VQILVSQKSQHQNKQRIKRLSLLFAISVTNITTQQPVQNNQSAKNSPCANILAITGPININCSSLTQAEQKIIDGIPDVLKKILSNQLDTNAVMKKLNEILHAVNPNVPVKTYFCNGKWKTIGPSATSALEIDGGGDDTAFQSMLRLNNSAQYRELLKLCLGQIESSPEWLTPRLFCGLAYSALGDKTKAKSMMDEFDMRTGPAYDIDACKQMSDFLHSKF
jgi:hypothetical protein